jgi:hypothetical protein
VVFSAGFGSETAGIGSETGGFGNNGFSSVVISMLSPIVAAWRERKMKSV